ncbi:unnamed protein product [Brachionus calyciflorus]|uniref:Nuclear receptor n=1 Tax=Brachionus calyciflorus TaxID=104777 RepID=A0A814A9X5_9BILA|nr:unnamed protein product [Brachionus calyciflorus]
MPNEMNLNDEQVFQALSYEFYLNKKRLENEKFEAKYNFGKCKVCSDEATGIHYGICTCEGCKGFFKRSILKHKRYVCRAQKNCRIYPKQRKKCKYCRWNACIKAGMSLKCVRMGRIPNSMKVIKPKSSTQKTESFSQETIESDTQQSNDSEPEFNSSSKQLVEVNQLSNLKSENYQRCFQQTYFSEKYLNKSNENKTIVLTILRNKSLKVFREQTKEFEGHEIRALNLIENGYQSNRTNLTKNYIQYVKKKDLFFLATHVLSMLEIFRDLPGFQRLSPSDVKTLLCEQFFTILGIRTIKLFLNGDYFLMLDSTIQMDKFLFEMIMGENVTKEVFTFYDKLNSLELTDAEIALLIPFYLSVNNVLNSDLLRELNEYYSRALLYEFSLNRRSQDFIDKFAKNFYLRT